MIIFSSILLSVLGFVVSRAYTLYAERNLNVTSLNWNICTLNRNIISLNRTLNKISERTFIFVCKKSKVLRIASNDKKSDRFCFHLL